MRYTPPATRLSVRQSGHTRKTRQPRPLLVAHPDLIDEETVEEQSQRHEDG
jgi:hypothetical protein